MTDHSAEARAIFTGHDTGKIPVTIDAIATALRDAYARGRAAGAAEERERCCKEVMSGVCKTSCDHIRCRTRLAVADEIDPMPSVPSSDTPVADTPPQPAAGTDPKSAPEIVQSERLVQTAREARKQIAVRHGIEQPQPAPAECPPMRTLWHVAEDSQQPEAPAGLTDAQIAEMEARASAATPGPWLTDIVDWKVSTARSAERICTVHEYYQERNANGRFIAAARSDVPTLAAECRRLRGELNKPCSACARALDTEEALTAARAEVERLRELNELNTGVAARSIVKQATAERERDVALADAEKLRGYNRDLRDAICAESASNGGAVHVARKTREMLTEAQAEVARLLTWHERRAGLSLDSACTCSGTAEEASKCPVHR